MYMFKYILKRLGLMIMTFLIIFLISFVLIKLLPIVVNVTIGQDKEIIEEWLTKTAERKIEIKSPQKGEKNIP